MERFDLVVIGAGAAGITTLDFDLARRAEDLARGRARPAP